MSELPTKDSDPLLSSIGLPSSKSTESKDSKHVSKKSKTGFDQDKGSSEMKESPGNDQLMLKAVAHVPMITMTFPMPSTYVPNSQMMYYVLHEMDNIMITTKHYSSCLTKWSPLHSRVYYGILFYIQTMRCMVYANIATHDVRLMIAHFEEQVPYSSLPIAGPLIPFFKALSVCSPPYPEYGLVSPSLPKVTGTTKKNNQSLDHFTKVLLPNLTGLFRGIANMRTPPVAPATYVPWNSNLANAGQTSVPIGSSASNEQSKDCLITPGTMYDIGMNTNQLKNYQLDPSHIYIPNVAHTAEALSWPAYLGLDGGMNWFANLAGQMQHHSKFFKGSSNLGTVSPLNGNTGLIQIIGTGSFPDDFSHRDSLPQHSLFRGKADSTIMVVAPPNDRYALFTQINFVPAINFNPYSDDTGSIGGTLFGPWWSISPSRVYSNEYDPSLLVAQVLSNELASDKPIFK